MKDERKTAEVAHLRPIACLQTTFKLLTVDQVYTHLNRYRYGLLPVEHKNSSGDETANMNVYAVRPEGTRIR